MFSRHSLSSGTKRTKRRVCNTNTKQVGTKTIVPRQKSERGGCSSTRCTGDTPRAGDEDTPGFSTRRQSQSCSENISKNPVYFKFWRVERQSSIRFWNYTTTSFCQKVRLLITFHTAVGRYPLKIHFSVYSCKNRSALQDSRALESGIGWKSLESRSRIGKNHSPLKCILPNGQLLKRNKYCLQFSIKMRWKVSHRLVKTKEFTVNASTSILAKVQEGAIRKDVEPLARRITVFNSFQSYCTKRPNYGDLRI